MTGGQVVSGRRLRGTFVVRIVVLIGSQTGNRLHLVFVCLPCVLACE